MFWLLKAFEYRVLNISEMSRCFPFPPPGYEKKARIENEDLLKKVNTIFLYCIAFYGKTELVFNRIMRTNILIFTLDLSLCFSVPISMQY